jgi:hypothetical protein
MYDGGVASMQIFEPIRNVQHEAENPLQRWSRYITLKLAATRDTTHDVVKQVTILAKLANEHARDLRVYGNTDATLVLSVDMECQHSRI